MWLRFKKHLIDVNDIMKWIKIKHNGHNCSFIGRWVFFPLCLNFGDTAPRGLLSTIGSSTIKPPLCLNGGDWGPPFFPIGSWNINPPLRLNVGAWELAKITIEKNPDRKMAKVSTFVSFFFFTSLQHTGRETRMVVCVVVG